MPGRWMDVRRVVTGGERNLPEGSLNESGREGWQPLLQESE